MYEVIVKFTDLQDHNYVYQPGDIFPRADKQVSGARLLELSTTKNRRGIPLIKFVPDLPIDEILNTPEEEEPDFDNMIKAQLLDYAAEHGFKSVKTPMKKAEIIAIIKGESE